MINHDPQEQSGNYPFFQKIKKIQKNIIPKINFKFMHKIIFHQMMKNTITKIINDFTQAKDFVLTVLNNQIFSNHTHKTNKNDNLTIDINTLTLNTHHHFFLNSPIV